MKRSTHRFNVMKFVEKPNLPQNRVRLAAISGMAGESIKELNRLGIETVKIPCNPNLPLPINSHADLQLLHVGNNNVISQDKHLFAGELQRKINLIQIGAEVGNKYPNDVRLNCAFIGNKLICNTKTVAYEILDLAERNALTVIHVNQGYTKCSICVVDENSIITDDESVFTAAGNFFNDVLFVSKGSISLKGYNYGFIGGCCGKIDKNKIAFNGRIESHTDYNSIIDFLNSHNVECIELNTERLIDIGGILPLCEE